MYQLVVAVCLVSLFENGDFSNSERDNMVILYSMAVHLHQWCSISDFMAPSNLKVTIVAMIGPKEYYKLNNKFWNASKKSPTPALAILQLKFHSL